MNTGALAWSMPCHNLEATLFISGKGFAAFDPSSYTKGVLMGNVNRRRLVIQSAQSRHKEILWALATWVARGMTSLHTGAGSERRAGTCVSS